MRFHRRSLFARQLLDQIMNGFLSMRKVAPVVALAVVTVCYSFATVKHDILEQSLLFRNSSSNATAFRTYTAASGIIDAAATIDCCSTFSMLGLEDTVNTTGDWYHYRSPKNFTASDLTLLRADIAQALAPPKRCAARQSTTNKSATLRLSFLHVPKTGGESVEINLGLGNHKNHSLGQDRLGYLDRDQLDALSVFTTIRDPHDRMLSWFKFCLAGYAPPNTFEKRRMPSTKERKTQTCTKAHNLTNGVRTKEDLKMAFASFVEYVTTNKEGRDLWLIGTYARYLLNDEGRFLPRWVIRFDQLEEDWERVVQCGLGFTDAILTHENDSGDLKRSLSPRMTAMFNEERDFHYWYLPKPWCLVQQAFQIDFELFPMMNWAGMSGYHVSSEAECFV